jgi:hypothetical protein
MDLDYEFEMQRQKDFALQNSTPTGYSGANFRTHTTDIEADIYRGLRFRNTPLGHGQPNRTPPLRPDSKQRFLCRTLNQGNSTNLFINQSVKASKLFDTKELKSMIAYQSEGKLPVK